MKINYNNSDTGSTTSSHITEVWFSKDNNNPFNTDKAAFISWDICYKINITSLGTAPSFPYLMEYNRYDPDDIHIYSETEISNHEYTAEIGECLTLQDIVISKIIFPEKLIEMGYHYAVVFDKVPTDGYFNEWYECHNSDYIDHNTDTEKLKTLRDYFYESYKYRIVYDPTNNTAEGNRDTVIQFVTTTLTETTSENPSPDDQEQNMIRVLKAVHESNYSNPHLEQITALSTQIFGGSLVSTDTFNQVYKTPNAFLVGNHLYNEDFSMRYLGEYLYLTDTDVTVTWDPDLSNWDLIQTVDGHPYMEIEAGVNYGTMHLRFNPPNAKNQRASFGLYTVITDTATSTDSPGVPLSDPNWSLIQNALDSDCKVVPPDLSITDPITKVCVILENGRRDMYFYVNLSSSTITSIALTLNSRL